MIQLTLLLSAALTMAHEAPVRIELRTDAEVRFSQVKLGDIAIVHARDVEQEGRLLAIPIGLAPREGETVRLDRETILHWVRARTGIARNSIMWDGASSTYVRQGTQPLAGERVAKAAEEALRGYLSIRGLRTEIRLVHTPQNLKVPQGRLELKVRPLSGLSGPPPRDLALLGDGRSPWLAKRQPVWVEVWVDGRFVRTAAVPFEVSLFAPSLVAVRHLPAGEILSEGKLTVREVEWSGRKALPLLAPPVTAKGGPGQSEAGVDSQKGTFRLRRSIAAGEPLARSQVEPVPLVARGDIATLHSAQGLIELESRVEVLEDGVLGQKVRVKLPNASSGFTAVVTGPGSLEVRK